MNHPPDDPSEIEIPMTRALPPTEPDASAAAPGSAEDLARTLAGSTRRLDPAAAPPSVGVNPPTIAEVAPLDSLPPSGVGSGLREEVGRIEPGQTLHGKYQVIKWLGGGAMGDVWLVRHARLKSQHALKVIIPKIASNQVALMRFRREFEVMASLRHEHAVSIYDACIDDDGGYIDMEYVEGRTIHEVLRDARKRPRPDASAPLMPTDWIDRVLGQLAEVLRVAHAKGIVHRDLKPSNLMLLDGREPGKEYLKVLDFGIAKVRDDPESRAKPEDGGGDGPGMKTVGFLGTPSFGSPEQANGRPDIDGRSDLYSVGVMLYEFLTGRLPFRGNVHWQVMHQHANVPPPSFAEANPGLRPMPEVERVVLRALAKDRDDRPQTAAELYEEFRRAVAVDRFRDGKPSGSSGSWESGRDPESADATIPPTWHDGDRPPGPPGTDPGASADPKPGRPPDSTDLAPLVKPMGRRPAWLIPAGLCLAGALVGLVVGIANWRAKGPTPGDEVPPRVATKSAEADLPDGYVAVRGESDGSAWPRKIRREADGSNFARFAPGIYLPEGFSAEPGGVDQAGWPRSIVHDDTGIRLVGLRGGNEWTMGDWEAEPDAKEHEVPAHPVVLSRYYIARTEVTNGQFARFLKDRDLARPDEWERAFVDLEKVDPAVALDHPAVGVSHALAQKFAHYVGGAHLPTEAQWEYAARSGGERRRHVWGNESPTRDLANIYGEGKRTAPVGSFPRDRTEQGGLDFAGNVREWCRDFWSPYRVKTGSPASNPCQTDALDPTLAEYVIRGAAFTSLPGDCTTTHRDKRAGDDPNGDIGFRVVVECPDTARSSR